MNLGAFSICLSVPDRDPSRRLHATLGFHPVAGEASENRRILRNGPHVIGLFKGMFEGNILTFHPGWDQEGRNTDPFTDIRDLQAALKAQGLRLEAEVPPGSTGPANLLLRDPDGNAILIGQHR
ncbi:MAG: VOC family protein [Paracoccaceae bacterium]